MKTIVIAEIGVNHNGDIAIARRLIEAAAEAKADYVKFQTFVPEKLASAAAPQAEYQRQNQPETTDENQLDMLRRLALSETDFYLLADYCASRGIGFLSSPFDQESIEMLLRLDIDTWKIPSGEITNYPYLVQIARSGKPVILSTGMSSLEEIGEALSVLTANGLTKEKITLLHCTTEYPTPYEDVHLHAMRRLGEIFGVKTGYSDHTEGTAIAVAAAALGACVIGKHFTLDRQMPGPDHKASIAPEELKQLVASIRAVEKALEGETKQPLAGEAENRAVARKSIVAATDIRQGELFTENNLTTKRPGTGISPMKWNEIIGTPANRDYKPDELITL